MKTKLLVLSFLFAAMVSNAQIDTTSWYPLHIGDKWQFSSYMGVSDYSLFTIEVIGDTLINGQNYFIMSNGDRLNYQRVENNNYVFEYNPFSDQEYIRYDFVSPDRSVWDLDSLSGQYAVYSTQQNYISIYGETLESKVYDSAFIDTTTSVPDTIWSSLVDGLAITVSKGLGITMYGMGINVVAFVGAIINGYTIGTITDVKENPNIIQTPILFQNYPNPFNPATVIGYQLKNNGFASLKVYDVLGREVATLLNKQQSAGNYQVNFNASKLAGGVYIYRLTVRSGLDGNFAASKKMILLK